MAQLILLMPKYSQSPSKPVEPPTTTKPTETTSDVNSVTYVIQGCQQHSKTVQQCVNTTQKE